MVGSVRFGLGSNEATVLQDTGRGSTGTLVRCVGGSANRASFLLEAPRRYRAQAVRRRVSFVGDYGLSSARALLIYRTSKGVTKGYVI